MQKMILTCLSVLFMSGLIADGSYMQEVNRQKGTFVLPALPYAYEALEPYIDTETMHLHHEKHHQAYVNKLNDAVKGTKWQDVTLFALCEKASELPPSVWKNAGGHWNHSFFWFILRSPVDNPGMSAKLKQEIEKHFGSVELFKQQFRKAGMDSFGSGYVWLIRTPDGKLVVTSLPNQDNPLMDKVEVKGTPLLACDLWEH